MGPTAKKSKLGKGSRVKITAGKGLDQVGSIFWVGASRYGDGQRFGISADDGETYWVDESNVVEAADSAPAEPSETFEKGDRVRFKNRGQEGTGSVFWTGKSRHGPGQRLGVRDDENPDDAVWIDARFCERIEGEAPAPPPRRSAGGFSDGDPTPDEYNTSLGMDEGPPPPPLDESAYEGWDTDESPDEIPADW
jgi:hypothetical protein